MAAEMLVDAQGRKYLSRFPSYEAFRAYRNAVSAKFYRTDKGQANMRRQNASPKAPHRYARYRQTAKYQAAQERYLASDKSAGTKLAYLRESRKREPQMWAARVHLSQSVRSGRLVKLDACSSCGAGGRIHGHHHLGYDPAHELDVIWLCATCHQHAHGRGVV